jgi:hypothetical protein
MEEAWHGSLQWQAASEEYMACFVFLVQMELRDDSVISWDGVGKGVRCYQHYTLCLEAEFLTKDQQKDRKKHLSFPVFHNRLVLQ